MEPVDRFHNSLRLTLLAAPSASRPHGHSPERTAPSRTPRLHSGARRLAIAAAIHLAALGCDQRPSSTGSTAQSEQPQAATAPADPLASPTAAPPAPAGAAMFGDGVITGTVRLATPLPPARPLPIQGDAVCTAAHAGKAVMPPGRKVGPNGGLPHVFVYLKSGIAGKYDPPEKAAVLDQQACMYVPHVLGVTCGQPLEIRNSDPTVHNVHALARKNDAFNIAQVADGARAIRVFKNPEIMIKLKCDVHAWMDAWVGVVPHPFFAVTGDDGGFEIKRLPEGTFTLEAWHELFGTRQMEITVPARGRATADFTYEKRD